MTSSFVKVMFSLISKVPLCFFPVVENVLTQIHIQLAPRREFMIRILGWIFTKKKYFTDYRVTQQEATSTRTISWNLRLQTKTPEKWHVNMANQAECETCFQANVLNFTLIFRCSGNATALTLVLESFTRKSDSVAAFSLTLPDPCVFS